MKIRDVELVTLEEGLTSSRHQIVERFSKHVNPELAKTYRLGDWDKRWVKAERTRVFDDQGLEYLDFVAGYGALSLGHNPAEIISTVHQASILPMQVGTHALVGALAENLHVILPGHPDILSFGSGGAEAVEIALKTARAATGRRRFIHCDWSYHGLTFGSLSVGDAQRLGRYFGPLLPHCDSIPFGQLPALEAKLKDGDVAAFIVEPIQGEGGCNVPPKGYLVGARELCTKYDALLILDEVQTGFGRTGKMFAAEHDGVKPDLVTVGKALGAGVIPISASGTSAEIWKKAYGKEDRCDLMNSTFGGNPIACAAALKALEILVRDGLVEHARQMGEYALQRLQNLKARHKIIKEVRGLGLLLGIEFTDANTSGNILSTMLNKHRIHLSWYENRREVLRFEPPLNVQKEEIDRAIEALDEACGKRTVGLAIGAGMTSLGRILHPP